MSDHDHIPESDARVADVVRALPRPTASEAFRQSLKADFISGAIEARDADTPVQEAWVTPGRDTSFWPLLRLAVAAGVVLFLGQWWNAGPSIHVAGEPVEGTLLVNGVHQAVTEASLRAGSIVTVDTREPVELLIDGVALFEVAPGTRMTVPTSPNKWFRRRGEFRVEEGEVRFLSGADFAGATYDVITPEGRVEIRGTLLSVQCDATGTCVCVLEGEAWVGVDADHLEPIPAGSRKVMPRGGEPFISPVKPMHADGVVHFQTNHGELIR
jgi:ferric-dicitrate binding protein FerR (iron transport regulator)